MRPVPVPIARFRVRPEKRKRLSVEVLIFTGLRDFRRHIRHDDWKYKTKRSRTRGLLGHCCGVTERRGRRKTGLVAVISMPQQQLTMGTITHEAFHATMRWADRKGFASVPLNGEHISNMRHGQKVTSIEEQCATVHDAICRRIVSECRRRGLLEK